MIICLFVHYGILLRLGGTFKWSKEGVFSESDDLVQYFLSVEENSLVLLDYKTVVLTDQLGT